MDSEKWMPPDGDGFLPHWFRGFEAALGQMDTRSRDALLAQCGKACSDSYTKRIYVEEFGNASCISDFLLRLQAHFPESEFTLSDDGSTVGVIYHDCACDLVAGGYLHTPLLCECSRQSLQHNWEAVLGTGCVTAELVQSILGGNDCCRFRIHISRGE